MNKRSIIILLIVVILVAIGLLIYQNKAKAPVKEERQENALNPDQSKTNGLEGVLRKSDKASRGNLMLELSNSDKIIYLHTSRDYSNLIDQEVNVIIDGTLESFVIINIEPKDSIKGNIKVN